MLLNWFADPTSCTVSVSTPAAFESSKKLISACTLYHDKGPEPWLRKTSTNAWLSTAVDMPIDGAEHDQGDIYCVVCYENGSLEIYDVPGFNCVFSVDTFISGRPNLVDTCVQDLPKDSQKAMKSSEDLTGQGRKENVQNMKVVELAMQRWSGKHSRPFLIGILNDGTILCYHAYMFEDSDSTSRVEDSISPQNSSCSRLRNLRFVRVSMDSYAREEVSDGKQCQRISVFNNIAGYHGLFLSGSRPAWFMLFRERLRVHPQVRLLFNVVTDSLKL